MIEVVPSIRAGVSCNYGGERGYSGNFLSSKPGSHSWLARAEPFDGSLDSQPLVVRAGEMCTIRLTSKRDLKSR